MYEFTTEKFSGPLEKLLESIEDQKLGIDEVSLAKVTDDFLKYLDDFRNAAGKPLSESSHSLRVVFRGDLRMLADFVAVASKLILLKSKYLLPGLALTPDEEADIKDLETRLARYRELRPAILALGKLWRESHKSYSRPYFLGRGNGFMAEQHIFYPGTNVDTAALADGMGAIFNTIVTYEMETQTIKEKIVTLEEKIQQVIGRIAAAGDMSLKKLAARGDDVGSRAEMVVVFLALLHLAREQLVKLEQTGRFSDIMVRKNTKEDIALKDNRQIIVS